MKKLVAYLSFFILVHIAIINAAISRTNGNVPKNLISGSFAHFAAFFAVTIIAAFILTHTRIDFRHPFLLSFLYSAAFAAFIEYLQRYYHYRVSSFEDILWGISGALAAAVIMKTALKTRAGKKIHLLLK